MKLLSTKFNLWFRATLLVLCLCVTSCASDTEDVLFGSIQKLSSAIVDNPDGSQSPLLDTGEIIIMADTITSGIEINLNQDDETTVNNSDLRKIAVSPMAIEWETVVYEGQPTISTNKNQKVLLSDLASGGYGYGVYMCDVASVYIDLSVPNPDNVVIQGTNDNRCGYYGNTGSNNIKRGTIVNDRLVEDRTKQRVLTYCYYIRSNSLGININKWVPCSPENAKIVYRRGI